MISIKPEWCKRIEMGDKIIEVRKSEPKEIPFKAYIYETKGSFEKSKKLKGRGKVIGEFICDSIEMFTMDYRQRDIERRFEILKGACLSFEEAMDYQASAHVLYAWHISDLKIYAEPKELSVFNLTRPPQNYARINYHEGEELITENIEED